MFASRRLRGSGTVCFSDLDRAAKLTEQVENAAPFYQWVKEHNKQPEYFANWGEVITEYYQSIGERWIDAVPVPSPYGYMGYDLIQPPAPKSGLLTFGSYKPEDSDSDDELFNLMCETDTDESDLEDSGDEEEEENVKCQLGCKTEEKTPVDDSELITNALRTAGKTSVDQLTLTDFSSGTNINDLPEHLQSEARKLPLRSPSPSFDSDDHLSEHDDEDALLTPKTPEKTVKKLTLEDVPPGTNLRDLPEGTRLEDLPKGCSVIINESDIEFGSEIEVSDEEEELELLPESDSDDDDDLVECDFCGMKDINPNCLEPGEKNLAETGGGYAHGECCPSEQEDDSD